SREKTGGRAARRSRVNTKCFYECRRERQETSLLPGWGSLRGLPERISHQGYRQEWKTTIFLHPEISFAEYCSRFLWREGVPHLPRCFCRERRDRRYIKCSPPKVVSAREYRVCDLVQSRGKPEA